MKRQQRSLAGGEPSRQKISLRYELWEIEAAVEGARLLLHECSADRQGKDTEIVREAAHGAEGVLSLVQARLKLVGQVIGGSAEARLLLCPHNAFNVQEGDDRDDGKDLYLDIEGAKS